MHERRSKRKNVRLQGHGLIISQRVLTEAMVRFAGAADMEGAVSLGGPVGGIGGPSGAHRGALGITTSK